MLADTQQCLGRHRKRKTHEHQWWILGSLKHQETQGTPRNIWICQKTKKDKATECYVTCVNTFSSHILVSFGEFGVGQVGRVGQVICVRLFILYPHNFALWNVHCFPISKFKVEQEKRRKQCMGRCNASRIKSRTRRSEEESWMWVFLVFGLNTEYWIPKKKTRRRR